MKKYLLVIMLIGMMQTLGAATLHVKQTGAIVPGTLDANSITGALALAVDNDIIQIEDSATYDAAHGEALMNPINQTPGGVILQGLTIQVQPGSGFTPTIDVAGTFNFGGSATVPSASALVVKGDTNAARLTLKAANTATLLVVNAYQTGPFTLQNVNLQNANATGPTVSFITLATLSSTTTLTNVTLTGGSSATTTANSLILGATASTATYTFNNFDAHLILHKTATGQQIQYKGGDVIFNNSNLVVDVPGDPNGSTVIWAAPGGGAGTITFNDCRLGSGNAPGTGRVFNQALSNLKNVTFNYTGGPTWGTSTETFVKVPASNLLAMNAAGKITFKGTPTNKFNLDALAVAGATAYAAFAASATLELTDCQATRPPNSTAVPVVAGPMFTCTTAGAVLNIKRCFFSDVSSPTGTISLTNGGLAVNMDSCIWMGSSTVSTTGNVYNVYVTGGVAAAIALDHCTFIGGAAGTTLSNTLTFFHNNIATAHNAITADYCIFDNRSMGTGGKCSDAQATLAGKTSLLSTELFGPTTVAPAVPGGTYAWIKGSTPEPLDPKLTATGRLTDPTSPAGGVGNATVGRIDIDGNLMGRSLGASSLPFVNSASGWSEFK